MSSLLYTPAEQTAALLQAARWKSVNGPTDVIGDADRLQYQREGGRAPSQRRLMSDRTPLARFGHWLFRQLPHS